MLAVFFPAEAQYVTIPDTAFVSWLNNNGFSQCMTGNQMDTTCSAVLDSTDILCNNVPIRDLTGIQYFKSLDYLNCSNDSLYNIPPLPSSITTLWCSANNLSALPSLSSTNVDNLDCSYNQLTQLPPGAGSVSSVNCNNNKITSLPPLYLTEISCNGNQLTSLPELPPVLTILECSNNMLDSLPPLPQSLTWLACANNHLSSLQALPRALHGLDCSGNQLTVLPALYDSYDYMEWYLNCSNNFLTSLPSFPFFLNYLDCSNNPLVSLPSWSERLQYLYCGHTQISSLPPLQYLRTADCDSNLNLTCLPQLFHIDSLIFTGCPISCIPDYGSVGVSKPLLNTIPFCGIFNANGCEGFWNISGRVYDDVDSDCMFGIIDIPSPGIKVLLDSAGALQQQTYTNEDGYYSFLAAYGNYTVQLDTGNLPFVISCPDSNYLAASLTLNDSLSYSHDFALKCPAQGFDIGLGSMWVGLFHDLPGGLVGLNVYAGDMSQFYGAHCASGVGGQLQLVLNGPITYNSPVAGALTPIVKGDTLTYNIPDFGLINNYTAFNVIFQASASAPLGTVVCVSASVTPLTGDINPSNNTLSYCFALINSHDPNEKEVYPTTIDSAGQWLTYTVRFQNTGTAPAVNIIVRDTLDPNLDPSTFQLLTYSAKNLTQLFGSVVVFNFPNINLPDSATSDNASRGFVQYRVKTISNLQADAVISNTASIYFDLNPPVVTNTVTDSVIRGTSCTPTASTISETICSGDTLYMWNKAYTVAGNYTDTLTNTGGCDSIVTLTVVVNSLLKDSIIGYCPDGSSGVGSGISCGFYADFKAQFSGPVNSFYWTVAGTIIPNLESLIVGIPYDTPNAAINLLVPGTQFYPICLTAAGACGSATFCDTFFIWTEGIQPINPINSVSLYPNPANNLIYIKTEGLHPETITIYDVDGRQVASQRFEPEVDIHNLTPGVYLMEINSLEGVARKRWVKM
jgi:uncharacterized repeat protein (TIGR01451 family)